jgi:hypothetical protein
VVGLYAKIANSLEYRHTVESGKQIDPRVYQEANGQAKHIITQMNNLIPGMTLGPFFIELIACNLFYTEDQATKDKQPAEKNAKDKEEALRNEGRNEALAGGGRRDEGRAPPRDNNRTTTPHQVLHPTSQQLKLPI